MDDDNFVFCIYGFLRDMRVHNVDMGKVNKFVYVPKKRYEDNDVLVTDGELKERFKENSTINAYDYDAKFFYEEVKKLNALRFNKSNQQPQRIMSFFKHIKESLVMFQENSEKYNDDTIIYLFRSDMGIRSYDHEKAKELLNKHDIIVEKTTSNGVRDFFFVFKKKNIDAFISLYDQYKIYLVNFETREGPKPPRETPESILNYHLREHCKKDIGTCSLMKFSWGHVCNKYCGHNKENTKMLGADE